MFLLISTPLRRRGTTLLLESQTCNGLER